MGVHLLVIEKPNISYILTPLNKYKKQPQHGQRQILKTRN